MLFRDISKIISMYLFGFVGALAIPFFLAIYYQFISLHEHPQPHTTVAFFESIVICLALAGLLRYFGRNASGHIFREEGLVAVVAIWFLTPALAALPFVLSGTLQNPIAAYFETTSGLTTTGATAMEAKKYDSDGKEVPIIRVVEGVIKTKYVFFGTIEPVRDPVTHEIIHEGIEAVSKALLFWRSFIQWLGGGGIVVLFVTVLPFLGAGGRVLFQTEVTGPIKDALTPRIKETAIALWKIYLGLTVVEVGLLLLTNSKMEFLDAITIAFSALSTGGFSIRNSGIAYYNSAATEWAVVFCMILGSLNFSIYYFALRGKFYKIFKPEFVLYFSIIVVASLLTIWFLVGQPKQVLSETALSVYSWADSIRYGVFHVVSAISSSGFSTVNYDIWPYAGQVILLILMFVGGMSGSTAGGIKIMRHYLLFRILQHKIELLFNPKRVQALKVSGKEVDSSAIMMIFCFFVLVIVVSVAGTLFYVLDGVDPQTSLSLVACMINDTGLIFRVGNPLDSCAFLSNFGYLLSCVLMILGRLEFFAIFALLVPSFWKQNQ